MNVLASGIVATLLAALLTPAFAAFARRRGLVVAPRADRWHRSATPLLGGAAIAMATGLVLGVVLPNAAWIVIVGAGAAFALGLADDMRHFATTTKIVGQVLVATILIMGGVRVEIVPFAPLAFVITVFWVVGIMNAVNLIDNMDGLAAGVVAIAGVALALNAEPQYPAAALVAATTAGAALGFLIHNFHPAKVFMGDAGSQLLGYLLAAAALMHTAAGAADVGVAIVAPIAILALPIFDVTLVTISRRFAGVPISRGGKDHTSHRLAALGLSDRAAVLFIYGVTAVLAALGLLAEGWSALLVPAFAIAIVALILFGAFLAQVDVYGPETIQRKVQQSLHIYARFGAEVGLDTVLLTIAYYTSYAVRFEGVPQSTWAVQFLESMPIVIGAQLAAMVLMRVYRTLWRYFGVLDAFTIARALTFGTAGAALVLLVAVRFTGYSRAVFVFDWLIAVALIAASRSLGVWLRHWFAARPHATERRVLILGAADGGALAVRLINRFKDAKYRAVGFLDDDPGKRYRQIHGVPILGATVELIDVIQRLGVDVVVASEDIVERRDALRVQCERLGVEWREFSLPESRPSGSVPQ